MDLYIGRDITQLYIYLEKTSHFPKCCVDQQISLAFFIHKIAQILLLIVGLEYTKFFKGNS